MFVIAENLNISHPAVGGALRARDKEPLQSLAKRLVGAGAGALNVNLGPARHEGVELAVFAVDALAELVKVPLCLDTSNHDALEAGIKRCADWGLPKPIINSFSMQPGKLEAILPLAATYGCDIIGLTLDTSVPLNAADRLQLAIELVAAANEAGVENHQILIDPVVLPIGQDQGQAHAVAVREVLVALPRLFDPPVRSVCGVSNLSNGAPGDLRPAMNSVFVAMLAAVGVDAVFVDVLDRDAMRSVRLARAFTGQALYSVSDAELQ